jgi:hypothetical protein
MWEIAFTTLLAGVSVFLIRGRRCHHRFGLPFQGHVRCMKCSRLYPIQTTSSGEWRIGRQAVGEEAEQQLPIN